MINWPEMALVQQKLHGLKVGDVRAATHEALHNLKLETSTTHGESVAVAVGSRGITQLPLIVCECLDFLKRHGLKPFIVPAMGSHGGNTIEGETSVLAGLGIDESSMKVPIKATTDVVKVGELEPGIPILMDSCAAQADHIVVINRVKPHTKFHGITESGITKMLTLGLSKGKGAGIYHRAAIKHTFSILQSAARYLLKRHSVLFGLAIVEDGYKDTARICAVEPKDWIQTEHSLLEEARRIMPRIPFDPIDILIIDEIGKDISGIGMDSNVTGRHRDIVGDFFEAPHAKRIFVRGLSSKTSGNGNGIGLADVTTQRLVDNLDLKKTYTNAITAISPEKAAIPIHFQTDRECLEACFDTIGMIDPEQARIVHIKNTLSLAGMSVSRPLGAEVVSNPNVSLSGSWETMTFDEQGNLDGLIA